MILRRTICSIATLVLAVLPLSASTSQKAVPRPPQTLVGRYHRPEQALNHFRDGEPTFTRPDEHGGDRR